MEEPIKYLCLLVFDVHSLTFQIPEPGLFRPQFTFLAHRNQYVKRYESLDAHFETSVEMRRLSRLVRSDRKNDHFWKSYTDLIDRLRAPLGSRVDEWSGQVPFKLYPALDTPLGEEELTFNWPEVISKRVTSEHLIWPTGWSTCLGLELEFEAGRRMDLTELRARVLGDDLPNYELPGETKPQTVRGVLINLTRNFKKAVFGDHRMRTGNPLTKAFFVVGFATEKPLPPLQSLPAATYRELLSWFPQDRNGVSHSQQILSQQDFRWTHLEKGSLISLSNAWEQDRIDASGIRCLARNNWKCIATGHVLANCIRGLRGYADHSEISDLRHVAARVLQDLPEYYTSQEFCDFFYSNHGAIRNVLEDSV